MVGKHIFVRCRNEQNNAGTWTAAMTENIVDKDIVRNYIEPRCNMDETFAQNSLMSCPTNNVLRIYYVNANTLVITRTYWVTDRITETQGRKGAYSISYILTGDDVASFCGDYSGAFDVSCFEDYDSLVTRTSENLNSRITISEKESIFTHSTLEINSSILERCRFTKTSFIQFMNGLYDAVENKKQLAVILPKALRDAWVENGEDSAEKLGHYILSILPDFMRINVGMVSHWSCQIKDKMVSDMPLIFVHPKSEEDIAFLKKEGAHVVDLDGGRFTTDIPNVASNYFSFIWDNVTKTSAYEDFWAYCKTNYKKLLRGRPTSASTMECIFLIRESMTEKYSDKDRCKKALLLAANEFAGAGTRVPLAEEFLTEAIAALKLENTAVEKDVEEAMRRLVADDSEKTKHQLQEYKILLNSIEEGTASPETIMALCTEVTKDSREAIPYFLSYLTDKQEIKHDKITLQMTQFVSRLFVTLFQRNKTPSSQELIVLILDVIKKWANTLISSNHPWQALVLPFAEAYIAYMKSEEKNAKCLSAIYDFLFFLYYISDGDIKEICLKSLQKEEVRIYRNSTASLDNGVLRIVEYANAFLDSFYLSVNASKDTVASAYERLFRMIFYPAKEISEKASSVYNIVTSKWLSENNEFFDKIASLILKCEENALKDKPPVWRADHTESEIISTEHKNFELFEAYYPTEERFSLLSEHFRNENETIYPLFTVYTQKMPFDVRQSTYKTLQNHKMLTRFFVYSLLNTDNDNIRRESETLLNFSHFDKLKSIFTYIPSNSDDEEATNRFLSWYTNELNKELMSDVKAQGTFDKQYSFILDELKVFDLFTNKSSRLINEAYTVFYEFVYNIFNSLSSEAIGKLSTNIINNILFIQSKSTLPEPLTNMDTFKFVREIDTLISSMDTMNLCATCEQNLNDGTKRSIIKNRMLIQLNSGTCGSVSACRIYYTMLEASTNTSYPLESFLAKAKYDELNPLEKGILLVDAIIQLHNDRSSMERDFGRKAMSYLETIAEENASPLFNNSFYGRWRQIQAFDYAKGSNFLKVMRRASKNRSLKFDLKMLCFCIVGLILTSLVMSLLTVIIIKLATLSAFLMILIASLVLVMVAFLDVVAFIALLNSKNRRKN